MAPAFDEATPRAGIAGARMELAGANQAFEASTGNCVAACRALGSMDRATGRLCSLATSQEDARVCDESKARLARAREQVRTACGSCPGGPPVNPNAPLPSP